MSPRRRVDDHDPSPNPNPNPNHDHDQPPANFVSPDYFWFSPKPARRWGLPLAAVLAAVVVAAAITASTLMLVRHEVDRRAALNTAAALSYTREFMTDYTTLNPSNADGYADGILAQSTGEFARMFTDKEDEIVVQVARSEPSTGTVLEAGVQRQNADGSVEVLLALAVTTMAPGGKSTVQRGSRWLATAIDDGHQWKIRNLIQVL